MEHTDICFAPVLDPDEAPQHPHNVARGTFVEVAGVTQPGPAPRFDRTPTEVPGPAAHAGQHTDELLAEAGYTSDDITKLRDTGAVK
jgi:alpha-methylacyl-CoA racemase